MPEIKRIFRAGKMNRTLDDRLVPNGEYREALNINTSKSDSSDVGAAENILGNVKVSYKTEADTFTPVAYRTHEILNGKCIGSFRDNGNERIYFFVTNNDDAFERNQANALHSIFEFDQRTNAINRLAFGSWLNFHQSYPITGINFVDGLLFWTDDRNEPRKINVTRARGNQAFYNSDRRASVAKFSPFTPPTVDNISTSGNESTFLEDKLIRFAYRYKYDDGEYSTISPLTPICFVNSSSSAPANGEIRQFINEAKQVFLSLTIPSGYGIVGLEWLYNESTSSNIYILDEVDADAANASVSIEYVYDSQDPFRTLPGNQLTRVYDAVPRRALSQEFAGGRLIYGNYLQNYNVPDVSFEVRTINKPNTGPFGRFSVKSRRTYQVGIVLADEFGRQTPVILSSTGGDTIFVAAESGHDAMQQLQIRFNTALPSWAHSYRVVVKQRQQEYYNWFTSGGPNFTVNDDNLNKIPRDTTQEATITASGSIAAVTVKVYPKVSGTNATGDDQLGVSRLNISNTGARTATVPAAPSTVTVFETIPRESELDIFYETSTGALTSTITEAWIGIEFYNCWIYNQGSGATAHHFELNRVRAGFNEPFFTVGLKAFIVQENFAEERRFNTLIHSSGLFNSRTGINYINQFNEAEGGITVSLDPADGSVQKLFAEDTQLIIFQEDKISRSPIDKDFIYSAEGGSVPVTSSTQYLGTIAPFAGEWGISQDPGSFAVYGTRKYFSDKNRGAVLRLSNDGITEISNQGMSDFFRDALDGSTSILGSYDEYHDHYNITIVGTNAYTGSVDTNVATASNGYFTLSFEEEARGWASFKSFEQESGLTLNNRYYTFNSGALWQHDTGTTYNNFYGTQYTSYLECILNDNPSDVKEFKTVNYEGNDGWRCDSVITDQDDLRRDVIARQLSNVINVSLNVSGSVTDADISGTEIQRVVSGNAATWTIKITPADPTYILDASSITTATFNNNNITFTLSGRDLYSTITSPVNTANETYNLVINGGARKEILGAILNVKMLDLLGQNDLLTQSFIPTQDITGFTNSASAFRAGPSTFSYVSGEANTNVEIGVRFENNTSYNTLQFYDGGTGADTVAFAPSGSISNLLATPDANTFRLSSDGQFLFYQRNISLPSATTTGSITITGNATSDLVRRRPIANFLSPIVRNTAATPAIITTDFNTEIWDRTLSTPALAVWSATTGVMERGIIGQSLVYGDDTTERLLIVYPDTDEIFTNENNTLVIGSAAQGNNFLPATTTLTRITSTNHPTGVTPTDKYLGGYFVAVASSNLPLTADRATDTTTAVRPSLSLDLDHVLTIHALDFTVAGTGVIANTTDARFNNTNSTVQTFQLAPATANTLALGQNIYGYRFWVTNNTGATDVDGIFMTEGSNTYVGGTIANENSGSIIPAGMTVRINYVTAGTPPVTNMTAGTQYRLYIKPVVQNYATYQTLYRGAEEGTSYHVNLLMA